MKTYLADIIPKIQRFSKQLDNLTLLTNQHWVVIDGILEGKSVYIFRPNGELLISTNGEVEKARWELLGQNSILVDMKHKSYLFKHGFFDENVLALKLDGKDESSLLLNETRYPGEINRLENVVDYLVRTYLTPTIRQAVNSIEIDRKQVSPSKPSIQPITWTSYNCKQGNLEVQTPKGAAAVSVGYKVRLNGQPAPDGKYTAGFWVLKIEKGIVVDVALF